MEKVRLDDDIWRGVGSSLQKAREKGLFGGIQYISAYDPKQADACREIDERVTAIWAEMPITHYEGDPMRYHVELYETRIYRITYIVEGVDSIDEAYRAARHDSDGKAEEIDFEYRDTIHVETGNIQLLADPS